MGMKIDSHQHFWMYTKEEYPWINEEMALLKRDFLPNELEPLLNKIGFDGSIAVQARQCLEETRWLLGLSDKYSFIKGVVGWADLCSNELKQQLDEFTANPLFKGVRHILQDEFEDQYMLKEQFQEGIKLLGNYGLTFDLLIYPRHIPYAVELVKKFPDQLFVLNHIGKPDIKHKVIMPWIEDIQRLAERENTYVKISGLVTEADWNEWKEKDFKVYLDVVFDAFGPERIMVGSDWPVCTLSKDYATTIDIAVNYVKQYASKYEPHILGRNCEKFYSI
ncbi:MAG: amidohydrolase family protein [Bacillota bacterium]